MITKDLIERLQKEDPSGKLEVMVDAGCYDYPVMMSSPDIAYISDITDEWCEANDKGAEKVISVMADN